MRLSTADMHASILVAARRTHQARPVAGATQISPHQAQMRLHRGLSQMTQMRMR